MPRRPLLRPWRVVALAVVLALAGAVAWVWYGARSSTPVSAEAALRAFRDRGGAAGDRLPGVPAPGVYTYRQEGSERGEAGPVGITRGLPDRARYVVTLIPGGYQAELSVSEEHIEGVRFRVGPDGTRAVWRRTDVTFAGLGRDDRRDLRPPPLHLPARLAVGGGWRGAYSAGQLPVAFRSRVTGRDVVTVGGRRVAVLMVRTVADTGGAHPGRRVDEIWWAPSLSLPARWRIDMEIGGAVSLRTRAELVLERAAPQR